MGWKDLMKNVTDKATSVAETAQAKFEEQKQLSAIKKEEQNKKMEEMNERVTEYEQELLQNILSGFSGAPCIEVEDNILDFYYEDITSMSTDQKTSGWLEFALTAAFKLCNITIYVSGAQEKIQTLYTYEAERVIRVYQEYRRSIKQDERNARQVVVQQSAPAEDDVFTKLEKLNKLKEAGILTEEEFDEKKAELLAQMQENRKNEKKNMFCDHCRHGTQFNRVWK